MAAIFSQIKAFDSRPVSVESRAVDDDCESPQHAYAHDLLGFYRAHVSSIEHLVQDYETERKQRKEAEHDRDLANKRAADLERKLEASEAARKATAEKLQETETDLTKTKTELDSTKKALKETQDKLQKTDSKLKETQSILTNTKKELDSTQKQLKDTQDKLQTTQTQLYNTNTELKQTKDQLKATDEKLQETVKELSNVNKKLQETSEALTKVQTTLVETQTKLTKSEKQLLFSDKTCKDLELKLKLANEGQTKALQHLEAAVKATREADAARDAAEKLASDHEKLLNDKTDDDNPVLQKMLSDAGSKASAAFFSHPTRRSGDWYLDQAVYGGKVISDEKVLQDLLGKAVRGEAFTISNKLLGGDPWKGTTKTFTAVYARGGTGPFRYISQQEGQSAKFT